MAPRAGRLRLRLILVVVALGAVVASLISWSARESSGASTSAGLPQVGLPQVGLPSVGRARVVETDDVGDPFVLPVTSGHRTTYVLYWTTDWRSNVPTAVSDDAVHWHRVADSLPVLPSWATPSRTMTWGPTVIRAGATWVLYYSTEEAASGRECIGRAVSTSPTGPFVDRSTAPLECQRGLGGDIDPSVVRTHAGSLALVWKNDGNATGRPVALWERPLSADGLSAAGTPTRLLGADQPWEQGVIEGPALLAATRGGWWLFYSGGTWQSDTYDTGVAWCATVSGPCRDASPRPILATSAGAVSPGGFDTFVDGSGRLWASWSAFPERPANAERAMAMDRVLEIAPVLAH